MTTRFFADLPALERFAEVAASAAYTDAPNDWALIITDVQGSTKAIEAGRYKDVNALGVASIVALQNALPELDLPFVFGGDGATLLCPEAALNRAGAALRGLQRRSSEAFGLTMRAGIVPLRELREAGFSLRVAKLQASPGAIFAMFSGDGFTEGERWIKDPELGKRYAVDSSGSNEADFEGFECRWQPIPNRNGAVISVLVQACGENVERTYREVIARIDQIIGERDARPVAQATLQLASNQAAFDAEAKLLSGKQAGVKYLASRTRAQALNQVGKVLLNRGWRAFGFPGDVYRQQVVTNSDYRKFDDTLRMVLDLSAEQEAALAAYLSEAHEEGRLVYGLHRAEAALMTCVIRRHDGDHVHFVDGANGGYALAAKQMKAQLKAS